MYRWLLVTFLSFHSLGCSENRFFKVRNNVDDTGVEVDVEPSEEPSSDPVDTDSEDTEDTQDTQDTQDTEDTQDTDDTSDTGGSPGSSLENATLAMVGDVVINEIMINPANVNDAQGEWIEIHNVTDLWIDLYMLTLADNGRDFYTVNEIFEGSMIVPPNGFAVVCATADSNTNGGVDCQGTFYYHTSGNGFSLSNSGDEVMLYSPNGALLDRFDYPEGFAVEGASMGVDWSNATPNANDDLNEWCEQQSPWDWANGSDIGTPNAINDLCF